MTRKYSFAFRRNNPGKFPFRCEICHPLRRFRLPNHKGQHDRMKHYSGCTGPDCPLYSIKTSKELSRYVHNHVEPDTASISCCNEAVDSICTYIREKSPKSLRPSKIIKSGSFGKGTAVKGKSDIDLVVFLVKSIDSLKFFHQTILEELKDFLAAYSKCKIQGSTLHAVKVTLTCDSGHEHHADILPSVDVICNASENLKKVYEEMRKSPSDRKYYSVALASLQKEFVLDRPPKLKTLIRLVKYWRKTAFKESTGDKRLPSSYPLELITIGEWEDSCDEDQFDLRKGFYNVLNALAMYKSLEHLWKTNYSEDDVDSDLTTSFYVIDPANPFNNVMDACNCWDEVAEMARRFLEMPLFQDLGDDESWN